MPIVLIGLLGLFTCFIVACVGGPGTLGEGETDDESVSTCSGYNRGYTYGYSGSAGRGYDQNGNPCR